jgi:hypothetical protein
MEERGEEVRGETDRRSSPGRWTGGFDQNCALVELWVEEAIVSTGVESGGAAERDGPEALSCVRKTYSSQRQSKERRGKVSEEDKEEKEEAEEGTHVAVVTVVFSHRVASTGLSRKERG